MSRSRSFTLFHNKFNEFQPLLYHGRNYPLENPACDAVMRASLAQHAERVIFINGHRPIDWESYINQKFAEGTGCWTQAELIDSEALACREQGWFIKDQTHLSYAGSRAYVNVIEEKLDSTL